MESFEGMTKMNPELLYLLTVTTPKELHSFYVEFYANFD
jgi:hypothetical protein